MEVEEDHIEQFDECVQAESVQIQQHEEDEDMSVVDNNNDVDENMTPIHEEEKKNESPNHDQFFENGEKRLLEDVSRPVPSSRRGEENESKNVVAVATKEKKDDDDDLIPSSPSPCKIARHEAPDLELNSEIKVDHFDPEPDTRKEEEEREEKNIKESNDVDPPQSDDSVPSPQCPPCLDQSITTPPSPTTSVVNVVLPKEENNNHEEEDEVDDNLSNDNKDGLDLSSYTLMFPNTTTRHHGSISATPITNNNGEVQNILVLNLPPGVNAVLSDQHPETEENVLMTSTDIGDQEGLPQVVTTNLSSPEGGSVPSPSSSPPSSSCTSSSTPQVVASCNNPKKNLMNGVVEQHPDDINKLRKCPPGIEPSNSNVSSRVKFLSQVTPEGYVFNTPEQNFVHHPGPKIPLNASYSSSMSSSSTSSSLRNDDFGRSPNATNLEMENWQKFRDHSKENSPTSILNGMQGFGPLANHIPVSSYILDSNQMMSEPPQISHNQSMQTTHQVCTMATSQPGNQMTNQPHPKHGQLTFCHNGLIPQPPMMKEEDKPCPLNYLQSMNPNYNTNIGRKTSSLLCLKSNLANSKENDPTRHLHNLNERKRRARITIACDFMRKLVPGLSDKTDKATVFEYAARYIHFLNAQVGKEYDANFLVKYCNY